MKIPQEGCSIRKDKMKRKRRKSIHHVSRTEGTVPPTRSRTRSLILAAPIMVLTWSLSISTHTSNPTRLFPLVAALPDVRRTSALSSTIERAVEKKTKGKIDESLRKTKKSGRHDGGGSGGAGTVESKDKDDTDNDFNSIHNRVRIESFLAPRRFSVRTFLRTACLLLAASSFLECVRTSGIPYAVTVWQVVYGTTSGGGGPGISSNDAVAAAAAAAAAAMGREPTPMECNLAKMILACNDGLQIMLPPSKLPSAGPLLKFTASIVAYVGLIWLLPRWSTKFRVLLDYRRLDDYSECDDDTIQQQSSAASVDNQKAQNKEVSVLVRLGTQSGHSDGKSLSNKLLVIPLQQSSKLAPTTNTKTKSSTKTEKKRDQKRKSDSSRKFPDSMKQLKDAGTKMKRLNTN